MTAARFLALSAALCVAACSSAPSPATGDATPEDDAADTTPPLCEADVTSDPTNCGACGHDCGSGGCVEGLCTASTLAPAISPTVLTISGGALFWSEEGPYVPSLPTGSIRRCPLDHCDTPTVLVDKIAKPWLAVVGPKLYATNDAGFVFSCNHETGCKAPRSLVDVRTRSGFLVGVAANAEHVFFLNRETSDSTGNWASDVFRCAAAGCDPLEGTAAPRAAPRSALGLVADETRAYWLSLGNSQIQTSDFGKTYASTTVLVEGLVAPSTLALDATSLYYGTGLAGKFADKNVVGRVAKTGGTKTDLVSGVSTVGAVAVDDQYLYWTEPTTGLVRRVPKAGGEPTVVAAGEKDPRLIVVGSDAVYWSAAAGIRRLAK